MQGARDGGGWLATEGAGGRDGHEAAQETVGAGCGPQRTTARSMVGMIA